jgi:hypothetical protein
MMPLREGREDDELTEESGFELMASTMQCETPEQKTAL